MEKSEGKMDIRLDSEIAINFLLTQMMKEKIINIATYNNIERGRKVHEK